MATRGRPSAKEKDKEDAKALGPDRVPENQKREVYERVRRAIEANPGVCTGHKVGSSSWDKHEQKVLEDGLRYYPHERHSNMLIYIRIAASLPKKTVRDVAHHLRQMQDAHRAKVEASAGVNPAKRHHPDPTAAAAMAAMHEHQMAAIFAANAAGGMAAMHTVPGLAQELSGPGPHLEDEEKEAHVCTLLQENMALISSIRENMMVGRFFDNHSLMINFDKNVKEFTALLATLPFADMQKLPVQVNPYFITGSLPPGMGPQQQVSLPPRNFHAPPSIPGGDGVGVGNYGKGNGHISPPVTGGADLSTAAASAAAPLGGVGGALPVPLSFAAHPIITPAAQGLQPQLVPEAAEAMAAAKAVASAAAVAIAGISVGGETERNAPPAAPFIAVNPSTGLVAPAVGLQGEICVSVGVGDGGGGDVKEPPAEGLGVIPPGT